MASIRALRIALSTAIILSAAACGGGGGGAAAGSGGSGTGGGGTTPPTTNNVVSVVVDGGPPQANSVNTLFTTITVCVPGSTTACQTIDHIQVDTGSYGLRILAPVLTLTLPVETLATSGNFLAECTQFVDGFTWGPITTADLQIAGEVAHGVPLQVIGDSRLPTVPTGCSSTGGTEEDTVADFGANGILGIGPFELDCGDCALNTHGLYYSCPASGGGTCTETTVPANQQVPNPVTHFAADNNGSIIVLPTVEATGASDVSGQLIFGIDTQSNNASGTETVLTVDDTADLLAAFNGKTYAQSFIDSGSNGIFFTDTSLPACTAPTNDPTSGIVDFYCPTSTVALSVSLQGSNGSTADIPFDVGNAITMLNNNPNGDAFPQLAGTLPAGNAGSFDYGLPFFYGRRVAIAIEGDKTSAGTGPYIAF